MRDIVQSIIQFLSDIKPKIEAYKSEVPTEPTVEEKIEQLGALEMIDKVVEEVETLSEMEEVLIDNNVAPVEVGLSQETESLQTQLSEMAAKLAEKEQELITKEQELLSVKQELSSTLKEQFSLSKAKKEQISEKDYLKQLLKQSK